MTFGILHMRVTGVTVMKHRSAGHQQRNKNKRILQKFLLKRFLKQ